jgi:two-component system alkaline phosphatase synthesis response regulator PhoP
VIAVAEQGGISEAASLDVLVIDDEDYIADMIASVLASEGYTVQVVYNGREGLERALAIRPSLLIIDIMMPYLGGMALIERLHNEEHMRTIPIVQISAGIRPLEFASNVTFLAKPFELEEVLEVVATLLGRVAGNNSK